MQNPRKYANNWRKLTPSLSHKRQHRVTAFVFIFVCRCGSVSTVILSHFFKHIFSLQAKGNQNIDAALHNFYVQRIDRVSKKGRPNF